MKRISVVILTLVSLLMISACGRATETGIISDDAQTYAVEGNADSLFEGLDGENVEEVQNDIEPQISLDERIREYVGAMPLEEKVAQMFIITPEALTGYSQVTAAGEATRNAIEGSPVGGLIYFSQNLIEPEQTRNMLNNTKVFFEEEGYLPPFLAVDEEGGKVARISNNPAFGIESIPPMRNIGETGDTDEAERIGAYIGGYLSDLGFNMDMAPDADVLSNPENTVIGDRSFGDAPTLVTKMVEAESKGLLENGIIPVIKHFPGHGGTLEDSHEGYAFIDKTIDEIMDCELVPFAAASAYGTPAIMVGHISAPNITGNDTPSSLSEYMMTEILRGELSFNGIIMTDAMAMGAIADNYTSSDAAVRAVLAGADIVLMPQNYNEAYRGVLDAVTTGEISEKRIDESVERILRVKAEIYPIF